MLDESLMEKSQKIFEKGKHDEKKTVSNYRSRRDLSNGYKIAS